MLQTQRSTDFYQVSASKKKKRAAKPAKKRPPIAIKRNNSNGRCIFDAKYFFLSKQKNLSNPERTNHHRGKSIIHTIIFSKTIQVCVTSLDMCFRLETAVWRLKMLTPCPRSKSQPWRFALRNSTVKCYKSIKSVSAHAWRHFTGVLG